MVTRTHGHEIASLIRSTNFTMDMTHKFSQDEL